MELADERRDRDDRSGPEARWDALGASCEPMDKLMRLVGLREVKDRAIQVYLSTRVREAATGFFRGTRVNTASNSHLVLVGNPGEWGISLVRLCTCACVHPRPPSPPLQALARRPSRASSVP